MNDHPKAIGDRSALAVMLGFQAAGIEFLVPFGENTRHDFVIDRGGFARVQCKTGRLRSGAIRFRTCSTYAHHPNPKQPMRHYLEDVDYFAVYCPETGGVYLIPIEDVQTRHQGALRVEPPRNNQSLRVRFAADCEIARVSVVAG